MRICYIKQAENVDEYINYTSKLNIKFMKNIIMNVKRILGIITIKPIGDGILFFVPYKKKNEIKLADKIAKKLQYYNIENIVIENKLQSDNFKNILYEYNINILNGRWLFKFLLIDILKYISNLKNEKLESLELSLTVNDLDEITINSIYEIASCVKRLNIVTNNIERLKNIENKLYRENGIMITISNNKRKSLAKSKIILNMDFPEEILNKYIINRKAILINIDGKTNINSKTFNGINANYYEIRIKEHIMKKFIENNMLETFDKTILYESLIYNKNRYQKITEKLRKDSIEIIGLIGNNGKINEKEFKEILKIT